MRSHRHFGMEAMHQISGKAVAAELCTHDDVNLDADTNEHLIECNRCGRWWRCYGELADVWADFIRFERIDGGDPSIVNVRCSPRAWLPR